jgi:hypothetical protein
MQEQSLDICSAAVTMYCSSSNQWAKISVAEFSESADNFCGKLLGAVIVQYILQVAAADLPGILGLVCLYCDNQGLFAHRNLSRKVLPDKKDQANLILLLKYLVGSNTLQLHWVWVEGHAVESRGWRQCSLAKKLNYYANELAKRAHLSAISGGHFITGHYPLEPIIILLSRTRVTGLPWLALEKHWGYKIAQNLFKEKQIIQESNFHLVWWEVIKAVMEDYPKMHQVWITKHVSEFFGTNVQMYYQHQGAHNPKCGCCGVEDEHTTHINQCLDPG